MITNITTNYQMETNNEDQLENRRVVLFHEDIMSTIFEMVDCNIRKELSDLQLVCKSWRSIFIKKYPVFTHPVLTSNDLFPLIISKLENPKDVEAARFTCFVWRKLYPVKRMIVDIKEHDEQLWKQLKNLEKFIKDGAVHYIDSQCGREEKIEDVLIAQDYISEDGEIYRSWQSWVAPFLKGSIIGQCKNPFEGLNGDVEEVETISLSDYAWGFRLQVREAGQLGTKGVFYQRKWFSSNNFERNLVISVRDLLNIIR